MRLFNILYFVGIFRTVQLEVEPRLRMELDPRDYVAGSILVYGVWEPRITGISMGVLEEGAVFIDVGANIGYHSLLASRYVGPSGRVVAIEPNPPTIELLRRNIRLNGAANVVIEEVACVETEQTLEFFQAPVFNTGESSLSAKAASSVSKVLVRGVPLDRIVAARKLDRVDLIKIDVEGAEFQALRGMEMTLKKYRPKLITELQPELLADLGASMDGVVAWLGQVGYSRSRRISGTNYLWLPDPDWQDRG